MSLVLRKPTLDQIQDPARLLDIISDLQAQVVELSRVQTPAKIPALKCITADTYATARQHAGDPAGMRGPNGVIIAGKHQPGDGGQGVYAWSPFSQAVDDDALTLQPLGLEFGRWIQIFGGAAPSAGSVGGDLSGTLPNPQVIAVEETGGPTRLTFGAIASGQYLERSGTTIVGITPPTSLPPSGAAGGDLAGTYPNPTVIAVEETGGPTRLTVGAIAAGQTLQRSGTTIIGVTPGGSAPTGPAGGDLGGTYPNPTVAAIHETSGPTQLVIGAVSTGQYLQRSGATVIGVTPPTALPPNGAAGGDLGGTYPNPTVVALEETGGPTRLALGAVANGQFLVRSGGTIIGGAPVAGGPPTGAAGGDLGGTYPNPTVVAFEETSSPARLVVAAVPANSYVRRNGFSQIVGVTAIPYSDLTGTPSALPPNGAASGDLSGTYPSPTVAAIHETSGPTKLTIGTLTDTQFLKRSGTALVSAVPPGDHLTLVDNTDTVPEFLASQLQAGNNILITASGGANRLLTFDVNGAPPTGAAGGNLTGTYPNPVVAKIRETSGPTDLTIGTITDGQVLVRSGTTLISKNADRVTTLVYMWSSFASGIPGGTWLSTSSPFNNFASAIEYATAQLSSTATVAMSINLIANGLTGGSITIQTTRNGANVGPSLNITAAFATGVYNVTPSALSLSTTDRIGILYSAGGLAGDTATFTVTLRLY